MKKWIGLVTGTLCILSSTVMGDEALEPPLATVESIPAEETVAPIAAVESIPAVEDAPKDETTAPKQVGKASADASNTAKSSNAAKYVLAAGAVVIGVAAIILVSRHHGHHHH